jgi:hypothetical protein
MGRKPLLAIAGAVLAGVTLSGCETGRPYYDGPRSYLPSQGYRGPYAQNGMMYGQPQMTAGAVVPPSAMAMTMKPAPADVTPALQLASNSAPAATTPMLTITMPAVRFQVPLTGAITYSQASGTTTPVPVSTEQLPAGSALPENQVMQALSPHAPAAPYATPPVPFTSPTVQSTNYASPAQTLLPPASYSAPQIQPPAVPGQGAMGSSPSMSSPAQYLPPVSPTPRTDASPSFADAAPPPAWPKTPAEGVEETMLPPVPPPIHRAPAPGTTPAAASRPTVYYP